MGYLAKKPTYNNIQWVIQRNLTNTDDLNALKLGCEFAEQRYREYTPHNVFVMDICETGVGHFIVECGYLNSAGFYAADIPAIVSGVTDYFSLSVI